MHKGFGRIAAATAIAALSVMIVAGPSFAGDGGKKNLYAEIGPQPFYLVDKLKKGALKNKLAQCKGPFRQSRFSIAHRGAPLQYPEHTKESYVAAARMGAGIQECDVTFTADGVLVCRHAQDDLLTTTDIGDRPDLLARCGSSTGNRSDDNPNNDCAASDFTLAELLTLKGKMDAPGDTPAFRTDLHATGARLLTHAESIKLFDAYGADFIPELKSAAIRFPFSRFRDRNAYAQALIDEYKQAGIDPKRVWPQSFDLHDILYWIRNEPEFGKQAVFLEGRWREVDTRDPSDATLDPDMQQLADMGVRVIGVPMQMLVKSGNGMIIPSQYAEAAKKAGLKIIAWTTERSGRIVEDVIAKNGAFYYSSTVDVLENDGDILKTIDVLARKVGVIGIFSDWPATTTFYANCMGLQVGDRDDG